MWKYIFSFLILVFSFTGSVFADVNDNIDVRNIDIGTTGGNNEQLDSFISPIQGFFFTPDMTGGE